MTPFEQLKAVSARLSPPDADRPICLCCGRRDLKLVDERPHPIYGVLGVTCRTFRCDAVDCGALTLD
jgi:hypothetical protein